MLHRLLPVTRRSPLALPLTAALGVALVGLACSAGTGGGGDDDGTGGSDGDSTGTGGGDSSSGAGGTTFDVGGTPPDQSINPEDCDNLLEIVLRDFDDTHPDMERADSGWGPVAGVLELELGADRKPVFSDPMGTHTWKTGLEGGVLEKNCWNSGPGTPETCYSGTIPMFEGAESFADWYHDTLANQRFERQLEMAEDPEKPGVFVYDSNTTGGFFPLGPEEGFGVSPAGSNLGKNFLFTTEIHLRFKYEKGQKFTFRGDDDLWIFVNGKMALDLGGLHLPFEGTLDFDAKAAELGISVGGNYHMDVFHAERHTSDSNFRIETNIACFEQVVVR